MYLLVWSLVLFKKRGILSITLLTIIVRAKGKICVQTPTSYCGVFNISISAFTLKLLCILLFSFFLHPISNLTALTTTGFACVCACFQAITVYVLAAV